MHQDRVNTDLDVFHRLKPIYGKAIDDLWVAFNAESPRGKAEILQYLNLLAIHVQRMRIGEPSLPAPP